MKNCRQRFSSIGRVAVLCIVMLAIVIMPVSVAAIENDQTLNTILESVDNQPSEGGSETGTDSSEGEAGNETALHREETTEPVESQTEPTEQGQEVTDPPGEDYPAELTGNKLTEKLELLHRFPFESIVGFRWETYSEKPLSAIYESYAMKVGAIYTSSNLPNQDPYYTMISNGFFISADGYFLTTLRQINDIFLPSYQSISLRISVKLQVNPELMLIPLDLIKVDSDADLVLFKADLESIGLKEVPYVELLPEVDYSLGQANFGIGFTDYLKGEGGLYPGFITEIGIEETLESGYHKRQLKSSAIIPNTSSGSIIVNAAGQPIGISTVGELRSVSDRYSVIYPSDQIISRYSYLFEGEIPDELEPPEEYPNDPGVDTKALQARTGVVFMSDADYLKMQELFGLPQGLYITEVFPNGPAYVTDVRKDDILLTVDGISVTTTETYRDLLKNYRPGDSLQIELYRPNIGSVYTKTIYLD